MPAVVAPIRPLMSVGAAPHPAPAAMGAWLHAEFNANVDADAFERWRTNLAEVVDVNVDAADRKTFSAHISVAEAGYGLLMRTKADAQFMTRSRRHIRRDAIDHFCIAFLQSGRHDGDYHHLTSHADTTSILFADEAQESRRLYSRFEALRLLIPRTRVPAQLRQANVHGLTVPIRRAGASLLASHIHSLAFCIHELTKSEADAAIDAAMLLVPGALNAAPPLWARLDPARDPSLLSIIKTYIDTELRGLPASPATIARTFGLSRSALYRLFESEGGIARYIMNRKLDLGLRLLNSRPGETMYIHAVAATIGFKSEAHFSRAFKKRFDMTPREARQLRVERSRRAAPDAPPTDRQRHMLQLFQALGKRSD